ncbi:hypothetical protein EVAR_54559_1 [Eumeta japonica]|uniref:Sulfatase N-terminal domain-containing protein n=1 Tax=Eumeta variegata TaxID=151549 RepID=A0A4C1ZUB7_EUMVA|nr:hypothetical protein EVAR_54559_1 [Eumeta japonica]
MLTGKNMSTIYGKCAEGMTYCNDLLIWSRFEEAGYATAYGEDYLSLPDTFSRYQGFAAPPTHHYLRPFFLTGENQQGPLLCTKKIPSAVNVLNYAADFAQTYVNESFFGFFWTNSYSHNYGHSPTLLDEDIVNLFRKLTSLGVMNNTIVVFASDHGIRYGVMRLPVESYYEERLPMLFMWIPTEFRNSHSESYINSVQNQFRLTTPYDFYMTFWDILQKGNSQLTVPVSEACPRCTSLFSPIPKDRNCADAMVSKQWCSCHTLTKVSEHEDGAKQSVALACVEFKRRRTNTKDDRHSGRPTTVVTKGNETNQSMPWERPSSPTAEKFKASQRKAVCRKDPELFSEKGVVMIEYLDHVASYGLCVGRTYIKIA